MEILKKPCLFKGFLNAIIVIFSAISGGVPFLIPSFYNVKVFNISLNWFLLILIFIITAILFVGIYVYKICIFYNNYKVQFKQFEQLKINNDALQKNLEKRRKELDNMKLKYLEYEFTINNIISRVQQGICDISFAEKKYLRNLYNILISEKRNLIINTEKENVDNE